MLFRIKEPSAFQKHKVHNPFDRPCTHYTTSDSGLGSKLNLFAGFGFEKGHIKIGMYKGMGKEAFEPVVAATVDTIIDEYLGGVAPLIMSIDTEVRENGEFISHIKNF